MSTREIFGVSLMALGFVIAPFGYWLSWKWGVIAALILSTGCFLYFTTRILQKDPLGNDSSTPDVYPSKELRGFHGADHFDTSDD